MELDYTPPNSVNTVEFSSDGMNAVAIALLASFITANIGSAVSKLMYCSPRNSFSYRSFLRSTIFASSDDPLRLVLWLFRRYPYRESKWNREISRLRPGRLFVPLLGRCFMLLSTILLIVLSIPVVTLRPGCEHVDYAPSWNESKVQDIPLPITYCPEIRLSSRVGRVASTARYCYRVEFAADVTDVPRGKMRAQAGHNRISGRIFSMLQNSAYRLSLTSVLEWQDAQNEGVIFTSDVSKMDSRSHLNIIVQALRSFYDECKPSEYSTFTGDNFTEVSTFLDCEIPFRTLEDYRGLPPYIRRLLSHLITGIQWNRYSSTQRRFRHSQAGITPTTNCPVHIYAAKPVLNIAPLAAILLFCILTNIAVSLWTCRCGNMMDALFHVVKEAFRLDTTTNPLEESHQGERTCRIEIMKWMCGDSGLGHVGFLGREGDVAVQQFDDMVVVGGCAQAAPGLTEEKRMIASDFEKL